MVRVATAADAFEAKLFAARLGAEGIVWEFRGGVDGMYPVGPFEVLVESRAADTARMLLHAPVEPGLGEDDPATAPRWSRSSRWFAVIVVVSAIAFAVMRLFSVA